MDEEIKDIIMEELKCNKSNLGTIVQLLENRQYEEQILTKHYINTCEKFWKDEIQNYLTEMEENMDTSSAINLFSTLNTTINLRTILNEPLKTGPYNMLLLNHYERITKDKETLMIVFFKQASYLSIIKVHPVGNIIHEKVLLEVLVDCLNSSEGFISGSLHSYLEQFYLEKITTSELIATMKTVKDFFIKDWILVLQNITSSLKPNTSLYLKNEFNAALSSFFKPVKPKPVLKTAIDARSIIEVTGTYIVVSECLKSIEQILQAETAKGTEVHEVHFVGALVVHIDTDLNNEIWHGRNIVVCTRMVRVHGSVTWNGNVSFVAEKIENSTALEVMSNGGIGSNEQDGGDGRDGRNGTGITQNEILDQFFSSSHYIGLEQNRKIIKLIRNIQTLAQTVDTAWINGSNISWDQLLRCNEDRILNDIFIKAETTVGNEIVYSIHRTLSLVANLFVYVSTVHKSAVETFFNRFGGANGLGGQDGFAGKIWWNMRYLEYLIEKSTQFQATSVLKIILISTENIKSIMNILREKYRLETLNKIAESLPIYLNIFGDIKMSAQSAANFLIQEDNLSCVNSHSTISTLKQFLWDEGSNKREEVFQHCTKKRKDEQLWKRLVKTYLKENGKLATIENHAFDVVPFDEQKCSNLMEELKTFLLEKGPLSKCYRLLLANMLNVNIRTYIKDVDDENKFSFSDEYNPEAIQIIYLLLTQDGLHELKISKDRLEKTVEKQIKSKAFIQILTEVEPLRGKPELDDYFRKQPNFIERMKNLTKNYFYKPETSDNQRSGNEANEYSGSYQMDALNEIIQYFGNSREKQKLKKSFLSISKCKGYHNILHNIQRRFACEGRHVSYEEISCLINSVLSTFTDREEHLNIVSWIAAAYSQQNWIDELLLLKIEDFLKMQIADKKEWRNYLARIESKELLVLLHEKLVSLNLRTSVTYQCFADIFYLLSKMHGTPYKMIMKFVDISEWPYVLREKYWTVKLCTLIGYGAEALTDLLYYLLSVENIYGSELTEKLIQSIEKTKREETILSEKLKRILCNFHDEKWTLNAQVIQSISHSVTIDPWMDSMEKAFISDGKNRNMKQLIDLIKNNGNTSKNIIDSLPTISASLSDAVKMGKTAFTREDIKTSANSIRDAIREGNRTLHDSLGEILYVIDKAIELERGVTLRDTQKLAILSLTTNPRGTLAQVSTGEGKSLIVTATAIIKALQGKKVHIVTSSTVLAKRDAEENAKIFNMFDVYASHNCNEDIEKRKEAYSNNQVIYGDLGNFQRDYLLDRFYGKRFFDDHDLENMIIDEVDNMLLDNAKSGIRLTHSLAGFDKLEPVYIFIWQWINRPAADSKELSAAFDTNAIKEAVLDEIYIRIHKTEIDELYAELDERQKLTIWARMIDANIIDECGNILKKNIIATDIDGIVPSNLECASSVKYRLLYILNECIDRIRSIAIPNYLKPFVEQHLECWIRSAVTAFSMKSGDRYVVDFKRRDNQSNIDQSIVDDQGIVIIDRDTGTDSSAHWSDALHQFLQLKHGCKLSLQNLKAVFISNVTYLKKYKTLNGLTGTLGAKRERDLLQEIYNVDYVIIPTAQSKQFHEEISIVSPTKKGWKKQIVYEAKQITNKQKRSVLIICETVNVVNDLYQLFGGRKETNVHTYTRDYELFEVAKDNHKLNSGQVIIATNLAGRGTDIKISDELNQAGGLHVILTYLPSNIRIEQQAFGRAARCGAKGSGKFIIFNPKGQESVSTKILELKTNRHKQELNRLATIKVYCDVQITAEEECFEKFNAEYGRLKGDLTSKEVPKGLQDLLLESCLDKWAYWLDENSKWISTSHNSLGKIKYQTALKGLLQEMNGLSTGATECSMLDIADPKQKLRKFEYDSKFWIEWVKDNPPQMVKLGKYISQNLTEFNNTYDTAIKLFDGVIQGDPNFSEVARYYKASVLIKHVESGGEKNINSVKSDLRLAAKLFERRIEQHFKAASIICYIKKNNNRDVIQINGFENQQRHFMELYNEFITSINNILGHPVSSDCFVSQTPSINKQLANTIFAELLHNKVLNPPMVGQELFERDLKVLCDEYGVSVKLLQNTIKAWEKEQNNEKDFREHLEQSIPIPNRRQFWSMLVEKKVLCDNKQYVAIQKVRLEESYLKNLLQNKIKKEHKEDILNLGDGQQLLYADWTELEKDNELIFEKEYLIDEISPEKYEELNELEALSFNKKANINRSELENVRFDAFDSIRPEDFANVGIVLSEAEDIIAELVKQNVLAKEPASKDNVYRLKGSLAEISDEQFTFFVGYKQIVKQLLSYRFAYRIAFDNIAKCLKEGIRQTELGLTIDPHRDLMMDLFEKNIMILPCVDSNVKDLNEKVKQIFKNSSSCILLNDPKIIQYIIAILNLSSSFERLEMPDGILKPFPAVSGLTKEQQIFALNGLNCLLQCEEKKWTNKMLVNTVCLSCIAVGQIVFGIGTLLTGFATQVGVNVIMEGVNDLIFAIRAMKTGHFSWANYWNQKWRSILSTVCTAALIYAGKYCFKFLLYGTKTCMNFFFDKLSSVFDNFKGQLSKMPGLIPNVSKLNIIPQMHKAKISRLQTLLFDKISSQLAKMPAVKQMSRILNLVPQKYKALIPIVPSLILFTKVLKCMNIKAIVSTVTGTQRAISEITKNSLKLIKRTINRSKEACSNESLKQMMPTILMASYSNDDIVKKSVFSQSKGKNPKAPAIRKRPTQKPRRKITNIVSSNQEFPGKPDGETFDGDDHFFARFKLTLYAKGTISSAYLHNPDLDYMVVHGPSVTQDRASGMGREADAAHLIRFGEINPLIRTDKHRKALTNMSSATQNVKPWFNRSKVAQEIDKLQSTFLPYADRIFVNNCLTSSDIATLEKFKNDFIAILKDGIQCDPTNAQIYQNTINRIEQLDSEAIIKMVTDGFEHGPITRSFSEAQNKKGREPENEE